ncbi:MAG TPA: FoF1 ATP synthase subunit a [Spirochaetales bacterium]|nr:FoF1 ATP synthase subunit a [Spirochaetales bacterium]HRY53930.1 FoF1 ATP synthase subunit a [Spirochaetia bacterium]HRZ64105.1 FoF1 ATP synthase subunit a [Spirochaetia bacterium]
MSEAGEALSLGERISESIAIKTVFRIEALGLSIPISDTVITTWALMALLILGSWLLVRRLRMAPRRPQLLAEAFVGFVNKITEEKLGRHGRSYAAFLGTLFLFLIAANLAPMLSPVGGFGFEPPFFIRPLTRDINVTAALAAAVIATVVGSTFRHKGLRGWAKGLVSPMPFMLPFNLMEYAIKPLSLALRLFGNILGAYIIMLLVEAVMPLGLPPIAGLYFDLFDGLVQAVVFSFLSTIYIAEAIE